MSFYTHFGQFETILTGRKSRIKLWAPFYGSSRKGKNMKKTNIRKPAKAALIAAFYVALTLLSQVMGLGFGTVQFRLSEALTILPVFTSAAIPGLALGCALANIASTLGPIDIVVGATATLLQAICTRALRNVQVKSIPLLSLLMPVVFNGIFIGAEIAFLTAGTQGFLAVFISTALTVGGEELLVCLTTALPLYKLIQSRPALQKIINE